ncbi:aldo/keto reductase [Micrococcales bacterium 31B]|nr:aldo/keto reductase [Micrococcales bacterium 31B]
MTVPAAEIRWGILAPGNIAHTFATHLPSSATGRLVAVASRDLARAQAFAAKHVAAGRGTEPTALGSYEDLLARDDVDAVYIASPHTEHARLTTLALAAGKHVVCEKPLGVNHPQAMAAVQASSDHGRYLAEGYMYLFHPQTRALLDLLPELGDVTHVEAAFAFGSDLPADHRLMSPDLAGGGILDVGGYPASLANAIAARLAGTPAAEPARLTAVGTVGSTGVDEWTVANATYAGGLTARLTTGVRLGDDNIVRVYGSRGVATVREPWVIPLDRDTEIRLDLVGESRTITVPAASEYAAEADAVAAAVASGRIESDQLSHAASLALARTQDAWRAALGLEYPSEARTANIPTIDGQPLARRESHPMKYGSIPHIDKQASRLVMGCDNQLTLAHASAIFDDFMGEGGNFFDTGYIYGGGIMEQLLGQWIANRGVREDVVIIGKGAHTPHCDPESITRQLLETLDRLQTDYVDIYMMHRDNLEIPVGEFVDVINEHVSAGRIRAFGGSNWTPARYDEANAYAKAKGVQGFDVLSNHFGLAEARDVPWPGCEHVTDSESRAWMAQRKPVLLPWSSQARGFFVDGRASRENLADEELVRCYYSDTNFERLRRAQEVGAELGVPATAVALAFVLQQEFEVFALFGPRTIGEMRSSMAGLGIELTAEQMAYLDVTL